MKEDGDKEVRRLGNKAGKCGQPGEEAGKDKMAYFQGPPEGMQCCWH